MFVRSAIFLFTCAVICTQFNPAWSTRLACPPTGKPRIRREWRTLGWRMRHRYRHAVYLMNTLSLEEGHRRFGPNFVSYSELVKQHFCINVNPKCDVGHFGPNFGFVHRALLLRFENSVLAIDPRIKAIPYWDVSLDAADGKFRHNKKKYIFSDKYFGSYQGDPTMSYAVTNGMFANFTISKFDGSVDTNSENRCVREGWIKVPRSRTCARCCGKNPETCVCDQEDDFYVTYLRGTNECSPYATRNYEQYPPTADGSKEILYTHKDFNACTSPSYIHSIVEWQRCIENERSTTYFPGANPDLSVLDGKPWIKNRALRYLESENKTMQFMGYYHDRRGRIHYVNAAHINVHHKICGELLDRKGAPNDPIFWSFHANVDRSLMTWQMRTRNRLRQNLWKYPSKQVVPKGVKGGFSAPYSVLLNTQCAVLDPKAHPNFKPFTTPWQPGTLLNDVVNDGYPVKNLFGDGSGRRKGHTFKQIIAKTAPDTTPYTYDTLQKFYKSCP